MMDFQHYRNWLNQLLRRMSDAMRSAQAKGSRRVTYNRPLDLWFPDWIKTEEVA